MTIPKKGLAPISGAARRGATAHSRDLTAVQIKKFIAEAATWPPAAFPSGEEFIWGQHIPISKPGKLSGWLFDPVFSEDGKKLTISYNLDYRTRQEVSDDITILGEIQFKATLMIDRRPIFTAQAEAVKVDSYSQARATIEIALDKVDSKVIKALIKSGEAAGKIFPLEYFKFSLTLEGRTIKLKHDPSFVLAG